MINQQIPTKLHCIETGKVTFAQKGGKAGLFSKQDKFPLDLHTGWPNTKTLNFLFFGQVILEHTTKKRKKTEIGKKNEKSG